MRAEGRRETCQSRQSLSAKHTERRVKGKGGEKQRPACLFRRTAGRGWGGRRGLSVKGPSAPAHIQGTACHAQKGDALGRVPKGQGRGVPGC